MRARRNGLRSRASEIVGVDRSEGRDVRLVAGRPCERDGPRVVPIGGLAVPPGPGRGHLPGTAGERDGDRRTARDRGVPEHRRPRRARQLQFLDVPGPLGSRVQHGAVQQRVPHVIRKHADSEPEFRVERALHEPLERAEPSSQLAARPDSKTGLAIGPSVSGFLGPAPVTSRSGR